MPNEFESNSVEIEALSKTQLKWGYWFITHKPFFRKAGIAFLILFNAVTILYSTYSLISLYFIEYGEFAQSLQTAAFDIVNIPGIHQLNARLPLQVVSREIVSLGNGHIDIAIRVINPNEKYALTSVDYQISLGGRFYESKSSFLLPGEEKYFFLFNVEGFTSGTPQVLFENEQWHRVIGYDQWAPDRLNFFITSKSFISARQGELSGQLPVSEAKAEITNATAYNYDQVEVQIILRSGARAVAFSRVYLNDFASGTKRPVSARWTQSLPSVATVEIIPSVNIADASVYQDFEGQFDPSGPLE